MAKKRKPARRSSPPPPREPSALTPLVVSAVVLVAACLYIGRFLPDDAYISFRYAENLVHGHGLAFNPGEPLEAYSNFLWILVCALMYAAGLSLPAATPVAGGLLTLGGLVILWRLSRDRVERPFALYIPLLIYALSGPLLLYTISGMETGLFGFLLMLTVLGADRVYRRRDLRGWTLLGAAGFLVSLTRPEGAAVLPIVLVWMLWDTRGDAERGALRRGTLLIAAAFVIAYAGYTAWRVSYFGDWLPTPFWSKGYDAFPILTAWKKNFGQYFVRGHYLEAPSGYYFAALALLGLASVLALPRDDRSRYTDRLALATALAMSFLYVNFVDWMPQMRYHVPLVGLFCIPLVRLGTRIPDAAWRSRAGVTVAAAVFLLVGVFGLQRMRTVAAPMTLGQKKCTIPLGRWLESVLPAGSSIAIGDVGIVPYESGMRTIDIHPESLTDRHIAREGLTVEYMMKVHPDAVIINARGVYSAKMDPTHYEFYRDPRFSREYNFIGTVRQWWYLDRAYWVFIDESIRLTATELRAFPTGIGSQERLGFSLDDEGNGR